MPEKLPVVSGKETIKVLVKLGFEVRMEAITLCLRKTIEYLSYLFTVH
ncbi:MAG: hypothetical protein PHU34_09190 [Candidatus Methanoperedens sp.]|nr:hypothetical protein [Candidatus Methanoperedens sp.]